jgi:hypothetical protein
VIRRCPPVAACAVRKSEKRLTAGRIYVPVSFMIIASPIDPLAQMAGNDPSPDRTEACDFFSDAAVAAQAMRHVRMLQELAEIAMTMARAVGRQGAAAPEAASEPAAESAGTANPGVVLTRLARCVRQTVALEARLTADYRAWVAKSAAERAAALAERAERAAAAEARRRERKKTQVERAAKTIIQGATRPVDYHDVLREVKEWLWDSDDDADFADRPIGEIIARICEDLYIPFDLGHWENEIWAQEEMRTKPPGSPFANHVPEPDENDTADHQPPDCETEDWLVSDPPDVAADGPPATVPAPRRAASGRDPP